MAERLTDRGIAAIKPAARSFLVFDSEVSGLAVRVYPSGRKVFVFDWRENGGGRQRRLSIGRHPVWTIGKARAHAGRLRLLADTGDTVAPGRGERIADLIEQWRATCPAHPPAGHRRRLFPPDRRPYPAPFRQGRAGGPHPRRDRALARRHRAADAGRSQSGAGRAVVISDVARTQRQDWQQSGQGHPPPRRKPAAGLSRRRRDCGRPRGARRRSATVAPPWRSSWRC